MPTAPKLCEHRWRRLRDAALASVIVIGGFVLASVLAQPFRDATSLAYPTAVCIMFLPGWWLSRRRGIHSFDLYEYAMLSACLLIGSAICSMLGDQNQKARTATMVTLGCFFGLLMGWIRRVSGHPDSVGIRQNKAVNRSGEVERF
jgi:hypothetical protein